MEPKIAADLGKLFRTPYSKAALDAALPPPGTEKPAEHHAALAVPLVRIHVGMVWDGLWRTCPDRVERLDASTRAEWERRVEMEVARLAHWICVEHLPDAQDQVVELARPVYRELCGLLQSSDIESELPPLPRPTEEADAEEADAEEADAEEADAEEASSDPRVAENGPRPSLGGWIWTDEDLLAEGGEGVENLAAPTQGSSTQETAPTGPGQNRSPPDDQPSGTPVRCTLRSENLLLRMKAARTAIIAEVQRRRENKDRNRKADSHRDALQLSTVLKLTMKPFIDPMLDGNITRRVKQTAWRETAQEKRAKELLKQAEGVFKAAWVPVEQSGQAFEMNAATFLKSAHECALSKHRLPPPFTVTGNTHLAKRARDYAAILEFLGERHRRAKAGEGDGFASMKDIAREVRGVIGGTSYLTISERTTELITLGFLTDHGEGSATGRRIAIAAEVADRRVWRAVYSSQLVLKKRK